MAAEIATITQVVYRVYLMYVLMENEVRNYVAYFFPVFSW